MSQTIQRYRKRPNLLEVQAIQWTSENLVEIVKFVGNPKDVLVSNWPTLTIYNTRICGTGKKDQLATYRNGFDIGVSNWLVREDGAQGCISSYTDVYFQQEWEPIPPIPETKFVISPTNLSVQNSTTTQFTKKPNPLILPKGPTVPVTNTPKLQRIKLRLYKHPVKLDATITEMAPDGKTLQVVFDGPLEDKLLYRYSEHTLSDFDPKDPPSEGGLLYEVL